jgi:hypothetical protein
MSELSELSKFDAKARIAIDPALDAVKSEQQARHPGYVIKVSLDSSWTRTQASLSVEPSRVSLGPVSTGTFVVTAGGEGLVIRHHFSWINEDRAAAERSVPWEITRSEIARLAREFCEECFSYVERAP